MKTTLFNFKSFFWAAIASLALTSCGNDDGTFEGESPEGGDGVALTGDLTESRTLDPTVAYNITGTFTVKEGVKLTIPAGTTLTAGASTTSKNNTSLYIAVEQGATIDIQGTENNPVLFTSKDGKPGDWGGLVICGEAETTAGIGATAEVGGLTYGGTNNTDNSGSINYLIIKNAGAQINSESQFNGLTLYSVGSGTNINNVALVDGKDDGVEFFGGTVSVTNLYLENNEDDAVDWTEGWNGTITDTYVLNSVVGFSTVVEADKDNKNPKIVNFTAVSSTGGTALQFKKQSGATITGLSLTGFDTSVDMKDEGPLANVLIEGEEADPTKQYTTAPTVDIADFAWVKSNNTIDTSVLQGTVTTEITLDPSVTYTLQSSYIVQDGGKLTIPAGTNIVARDGGTSVYIAVLQGGEIDIQGTESNPVIISSANANAGDWGGLTLCGKSTTTAGVGATAEVGGFIYGGTDTEDNSGNISYLIIKGTGAQINSESQYNGISFYAVGSATTINNIAVINGSDDGLEFFGGTVSASNIYLENNEDDALDWTEGWNGTVTNSYILHTIDGFSTVIEGDKDNSNPKFINLTAISETGGTALQFKKQSGATISGLSLTGYTKSIDMKDDGPLENVIIVSKDAEGTNIERIADPALSYNAIPSVDVTTFDWVNTDITLTRVELKGEVTTDITLDPTKLYDLTSSYIIKDGGSVTIPAGTKIVARNGGTDVYIAVLMGGKININGTTSNPVVISSEDSKAGDWGGLTICGKSTTTAGVGAIAEVGGFIYGGTATEDNSGTINNLVIIGTGAQINADSQYNGISLYAVGSGTTISNIAVISGSDDGVEFFGGTVSATNLYLENNEDDAVDWTEGWNGTVTNTYVSHTIDGFSTAIEGDKINNNPKLINFTAISTTGGTALQFKKQSGATITNLYLSGYTKQIDMKDGGPLANVLIDGTAATTTANYNTGTQVDIASWTWKNARL